MAKDIISSPTPGASVCARLKDRSNDAAKERGSFRQMGRHNKPAESFDVLEVSVALTSLYPNGATENKGHSPA